MGGEREELSAFLSPLTGLHDKSVMPPYETLTAARRILLAGLTGFLTRWRNPHLNP